MNEPALTHAQRGLIALVGRGLSNVEIAVELGISERTVQDRLWRLRVRLDPDGQFEGGGAARKAVLAHLLRETDALRAEAAAGRVVRAEYEDLRRRLDEEVVIPWGAA